MHLSLAMAIDAELLVLDEPTLGLDLSYRKQFYSQLIEDYFDGNKTIIISTHQVEEIEGVLSDVVFIDKGKAIMKESIESLNEKYLELRPKEDLKERARSLNPFYSRIELGREVFLFENQGQDKLSELGTVHPPAIADLFLAIVKLFVSNVPAKSIKDTWAPTCGEAGNVIVFAPPDVSTKYLSFAATVIFELVEAQGLPQSLQLPVACSSSSTSALQFLQ